MTWVRKKEAKKAYLTFVKLDKSNVEECSNIEF